MPVFLLERPSYSDVLAQHARVRDGIVALDQEAGLRVLHGDRQAADRGRQHRRTGRLRLDGHQPEGLAVRRHDQHGRRPEPVRELFLPDGRPEPYDIGDAEPRGQLLQALRLGEPAAARAADHRHDDPRP